MKLHALTAAAVLTLAQSAAATPMLGTISFQTGTPATNGSLTFSYDSATAPIGSACGALCTLTAFSDGDFNFPFVTSFNVIFGAVDQVASWSATLFRSIIFSADDASYVGSADHNLVKANVHSHGDLQFVCTGPFTCSIKTVLVPEPKTEALGTWTASVENAPAPPSQVPEPSAAVLALIGLGAMMRRRQG